MAGVYPDAPGYRFAYDIDGTIMAYYNTTAVVATSAQLHAMNNDSFSDNWTVPAGGANTFCILFPEPRSVTGILLNRTSIPFPVNLEYSSDTTDGLTGTWSLANSNFTGITASTKSQLRDSITPLSIETCTALRFQYSAGITGSGPGSRVMRNIHLYGQINPLDSPDRLRIVDMSNSSTTSDGATSSGLDISSQLDFGDINQRSSSTKQIKVVNNSSTKTASNITVSFEAPTDASPSIIGQLQISTDNIAYSNAVNIGNLNPGESSPTLYLRFNASANAQLSTWSARIIAHAVSWS